MGFRLPIFCNQPPFFPKFYVPPGSSLIIHPCTPAICDRIFKYFFFLSLLHKLLF